MNCPDGNPCETWFIADGSLVCRHGVCAFPSSSTNVDFKCPAKLIQQYEEEKLKDFFNTINKINWIQLLKAMFQNEKRSKI